MIKINIGKCIIEKCNNPQYVKHFCMKHYARYLKYGDTNIYNGRFWLNKYFSEKHKSNLSEALMGRKLSEEHKKNIKENNAKFWLGKNRSKKTKEKISETLKKKGIRPPRWWKEYPEEIKNKILKKMLNLGNKNTLLEQKIEKELKRRNIKFLSQYALCGITIADFYLPQNRTVIYCDGEYWHSRPERKNRDINQDFILSFNGYNIYRFTGTEINKSPVQCINKIIELT